MATRAIRLTSLAMVVCVALSHLVQAADPSLIGWWKFDEGTGTLAKDSSGNGNDGNILGSPAWVPGVSGSGLGFNGQNVYVNTGKSLLNNVKAFTYAGWVSASNTTVYSSLFGQNELIEFGFTSESGGRLGTWMAGNAWAFVGAQYPYTYPSWHHVALAADSAAVIIYIDGQEAARGTGGMTSTGTSSFFFSIGGAVFNTTGDWFLGEMDDVRLYTRALAADELPGIMRGDSIDLAANPVPANRATDVPSDTALAWEAGVYAKTHDVYLGTGLDDVNSAARSHPNGSLVSQGQDGLTYSPATPLTFGQTYYWRVDEVNAAPDSSIHAGETWSFAVEPYGYPVKPVKATASGSMTAAMGPEKTIDGSGLDALDQHLQAASQMWLSKKNSSPIWIQYEFDGVYSLYQMWVWNSNQVVESQVGFGAQDVTIETSTDGTTWTSLAGVPEFTQATGEPNYVHNTTVDFGGVLARYVKLTINSSWSGSTKQAGLAEVRFFYVPVKAFVPSPVLAATDVSVNGSLNWRPGRKAASHRVYLSTDPKTVANDTAPVKTATQHTLDLGPLGLDYGRTYYWKVDEVNDAASPSVWEGDVWSFTTIGYAVVDDFESYDDQCNRVFFAWVDGFGHSGSPECSVAPSAGNATGSTVGNVNPPFAEKSIVHAGSQAMPMAYDNIRSPFYSEAQREWPTPQSWTGHGVDTLVVYLRGTAPAFAETTPGTILMNGIGTDVWDATDQFRFVYKTLKGNGSIVAKVESVATSHEWAKAGVMIRESVSSGSTHALCAATPTASHGVSFQRRIDTDVASNQSTDVANTPLPRWVRVTRNGSTFTAQHSSDGKTWTDVTTASPVTINMANDVLVGLAVTSHAATTATSARFSNVSTSGSVSGSWQVAEIGASQPSGNLPEPFYLAVQDSAGTVKVVTHPDPTVISTGTWQEWSIPLTQFTSSGVNLTSVKKMFVGIGDRTSPKAGNAGKLTIDDIRLTRVGP